MDNDHYYLESYEIYSADINKKTDGATALDDLPQTRRLWNLLHLFDMNHTVWTGFICIYHELNSP